MANQLHRGLRRLCNATFYSWAGLKAAWRHEEAFRQEVLLCAFLVPVGLWLGTDSVERALLIGSLILVLIVELLNSSIEAAVDRVGSERHDLAERAKDVSSAAVFVALLNVALMWIILLFT
jgi:diacylglycerol kinase (ATP)